MIPITRLRPSSIRAFYHFRCLFVGGPLKQFDGWAECFPPVIRVFVPSIPTLWNAHSS